MAEIAVGAEGADLAVLAELALNMNVLFHFSCLGHQDFKNKAYIINVAYNWLWEPYAVTRDGWDGLIIPFSLL